jgi:hypothetical protein
MKAVMIQEGCLDREDEADSFYRPKAYKNG